MKLYRIHQGHNQIPVVQYIMFMECFVVDGISLHTALRKTSFISFATTKCGIGQWLKLVKCDNVRNGL